MPMSSSMQTPRALSFKAVRGSLPKELSSRIRPLSMMPTAGTVPMSISVRTVQADGNASLLAFTQQSARQEARAEFETGNFLVDEWKMDFEPDRTPAKQIIGTVLSPVPCTSSLVTDAAHRGQTQCVWTTFDNGAAGSGIARFNLETRATTTATLPGGRTALRCVFEPRQAGDRLFDGMQREGDGYLLVYTDNSPEGEVVVYDAMFADGDAPLCITAPEQQQPQRGGRIARSDASGVAAAPATSSSSSAVSRAARIVRSTCAARARL